MAAAAACAAGFFCFLFTSKKELWLVNELGEHITYRQGEGDKDEYFLK